MNGFVRLVGEITFTVMMLTGTSFISSTLTLKRFESEHYIIVMPKTDVKKAIEDKNAGRAMKDHKAKQKVKPQRKVQ